MGVLDILRGGVKGVAEASGNQGAVSEIDDQQQRSRDDKANKIRMQIAPLALAAQGIQSQLPALLDPATGKPRPESQARYDELHDQLSDIIHKQRMILLPPPKEDPHGLGHLMHTATDKLHITRNAVAQAKAANQKKIGDYNKESDAQVKETMQGVVPSPLTLQEIQQGARVKAGIDAKATTPKTGTEKATWLTGPDGQQHPYELKDGKYIPVEAPEGAKLADKPETDYQKAQLDFKTKSLALQEAKFKASQDPNNPATHAALLRAQQEATRSQAYMIRAQASAFGSYNGKPLTGALETPEGETIGSMFASNFYKSAQGMAQLNDAQGSINQVGDAVSKLYQSGKSLSSPNIATALANPAWTAAKLAQGIAGKALSPEEQEAVVAIRSAQENIQGMRKAAGGGLSNEQVNRLEAQLPGPNTPNAAMATKQLQYLNQTLARLSQGVPSTVGGPTFQGAKTKELRQKQNKKGGKEINYKIVNGELVPDASPSN